MQFKRDVLNQLYYTLGREQGGPTHYLEGIKDAIKIVENKWNEDFFQLFERRYRNYIINILKRQKKEDDRTNYDEGFIAGLEYSLGAFDHVTADTCRELVVGENIFDSMIKEKEDNLDDYRERDTDI